METRINVKDRWVYSQLPGAEKVGDAEVEAIYDQEVQAFWDAASDYAEDRGFDGVYQEGRSGGYAVPYPQNREITCPTCNGWGDTEGPCAKVGPFEVKPPDCPTCHGEGEILDPEESARLEGLAEDLRAEMDYRRDEFKRRVRAVADVVGVYEPQS